MPKKKFVDKKNAVTFHLVHRSQKDPLQADEDAPKRVLLPVQDTAKARQEEQAKYGIFFDDDYDYLQHLKETDELNEVAAIEAFRIVNDDTHPERENEIRLPSSIFGTEYETHVGLLNKAAPIRGPQPDWDPDIVEALDVDFDFDNQENELEDDFVTLANAEGPPGTGQSHQDTRYLGLEGEDDYDDGGGGYASDEADFSENDDLASLGEQSFMSAETKSRFTNYSMSSSVIKRNAGLTLLDDRFEQLFEQYDDTEIGALDQNDITGFVADGDLLLENALDEWTKQTEKTTLMDVVVKADEAEVASDSELSELADTDVIEVTESRPEEKWDCESILSTYSNIYNHPKKITEPSIKKPIQLTRRLGIPDDALAPSGPTLRQQEREQHKARDAAPTLRPKHESAEERRARKQAVKQHRRERREEKKMNKDAFKQEELRQRKELLNLNQNLKGIKIV